MPLGYRYRVNRDRLPTQNFGGDIVWGGRRIVVFLDGCSGRVRNPRHDTQVEYQWWHNKIERQPGTGQTSTKSCDNAVGLLEYLET